MHSVTDHNIDIRLSPSVQDGSVVALIKQHSTFLIKNMSRREIIELDQIPEPPEEMEESVPKRHRTSQRKSSQS